MKPALCWFLTGTEEEKRYNSVKSAFDICRKFPKRYIIRENEI